MATSFLYWPRHLCDAPSGFLVGWSLREFNVCVSCVVHHLPLVQLDTILQHFEGDPACSDLCHSCGSSLVVLGEWSNDLKSSDAISSSRKEISECISNANIWIRCYLDQTRGMPRLRDIHCCGSRSVPTPLFILFSHPSSKYFYSLKTLDLDPISALQSVYIRRTEMLSEMYSMISSVNASAYVQFTLHNARPQIADTRWDSIRRSGMSPYDRGKQVDGKIADPSRLWIRRKSVQEDSKLHRKQRVCCSGMWGLWKDILLVPFSFFALFLYIMAVAMLKFLKKRVWTWSGKKEVASLLNLASQVRFHVTEFISLPLLWVDVKDHRRIHPALHAKALRMYDTIIRILVDLGLGFFCCAVMFYATDEIVDLSLRVEDAIKNNVFLANLEWFMGYPAGLKLNAELTERLGRFAMGVVYIWDGAIRLLQPIQPYIFRCLALSGLFGASILFSLCQDLISLVSLHIYGLYHGVRWLYSAQLSILVSLWTFFQGKKKNVLRKRVDTHHYGIDQLLLGTLLFCGTVFLFPTTIVYYAFFSLTYGVVVCLQFMLHLIRSFVNYFPFYSFYTRAFDSGQLPGGIYFDVIPKLDGQCDGEMLAGGGGTSLSDTSSRTTSLQSLRSMSIDDTDGRIFRQYSAASLWNSPQASTNVGYLVMKSRPLPIGHLFYEYKKLFSSVLKAYSPLRFLGSLMIGRPMQSQSSPLQKHLMEKCTPLSSLDFWIFLRLALGAGHDE